MYHDGKGNLTDTPVSNPHGGQNTQKMVFWTGKRHYRGSVKEALGAVKGTLRIMQI